MAILKKRDKGKDKQYCKKVFPVKMGYKNLMDSSTGDKIHTVLVVGEDGDSYVICMAPEQVKKLEKLIQDMTADTSSDPI